MKPILWFVALASTAALAAELHIPTATQIYPYLATVCLNDAPASTYGATGTDASGNLVGMTSTQGFVCKLKVHTGRGPGIRIFSACADVVWDYSTGAIVSVTPSSHDTNYSISCQ
jgi:hypothetical protein